MHSLAVLAVTLLASAAPDYGAAPSAANTEDASPLGRATQSVVIDYEKPKEAAHQAIYAEVQGRKVLEQLADALSVVRLPKKLTLTFKGCDGTSNAYYNDLTNTIIFCYELVADIKKAAVEGHVQKPFVQLQDAIDGPIVFVMLHETAHAIFDLLEVPILGKQEDAADAFAALAILRMGPTCKRMIKGAAWAYHHDATSRENDESDFADIHSLDSQRYYNLLCLAYGSDKQAYADAITVAKLPRERAIWCGLEYRQAVYAVQKLIAPSIDQRRLEYVRAQHHAKMNRAAESTPTVPPRSE